MGLGKSYFQKEERNTATLEHNVRHVYSALKETEQHISKRYNYIDTILPDEIFFITSQNWKICIPTAVQKEREYRIAKAKSAVFISQIGKVLSSGEKA